MQEEVLRVLEFLFHTDRALVDSCAQVRGNSGTNLKVEAWFAIDHCGELRGLDHIEPVHKSRTTPHHTTPRRTFLSLTGEVCGTLRTETVGPTEVRFAMFTAVGPYIPFAHSENRSVFHKIVLMFLFYSTSASQPADQNHLPPLSRPNTRGNPPHL